MRQTKKQMSSRLPTGWKEIPFGDVFSFLSTLSLSREKLVVDESEDGVYNIHYGDLHATYASEILDFSKEKRVPKVLGDISNEVPFLQDGDLIIADASEDYEGVGKSMELCNVGIRKIIGGLHLFVARDNIGLTAPGFRTYVLKNPNVFTELKKLATGSKVYGISKSNLAKLRIVLPPLPEQRRIAKILSTWDEAIEQQMKLIELKEKRKKALMQKLLSGEVRFPGFEGEWDTARLRDVSELIKDGTHGTHVEVSLGVPLLSAKDIFNGEIHIPGDCRKISSEDYRSIHSRYKPEGGDILLTVVGTIGRCALVHQETPQFTFQRSVAIVRIKKEYDFNFFYQLFTSDKFIHQLNLRSNASAQAGVYLGELEKMEVSFPLDTAEQKVIADILGACDLEMKHYKKKLTALIKQKQGIIQQLLTGQTRVYN